MHTSSYNSQRKTIRLIFLLSINLFLITTKVVCAFQIHGNERDSYTTTTLVKKNEQFLQNQYYMTTTSNEQNEDTRSIYERVLDEPKYPPEWPFSDDDFTRQDESIDSIFYDSPRLVYHIDDNAVSALTDYYKENLKDGDDVLDICSSWVSHYPVDWKGGNVVGLGMNEYELSQNKQLTSYISQDLNQNPVLPLDDNSFDVVTCVVSIDYLTKPLEIIKEIGRVLRPGGACMISISNRCFPTKAFRIWLLTNDLEHIFIVGSMFHYANTFKSIKCDDVSPNPGRSDPLFIVRAKKK